MSSIAAYEGGLIASLNIESSKPIKLMNPTTDGFALPRPELRMDAFRRYEQDIGRACRSDIVIDPSQRERPLSPHTYIVRFRDAILGYTRYHYPSSVIPPNFNLSLLRCEELSTGKVSIFIPGRNLIVTKPMTLEDVAAPDPYMTKAELAFALENGLPTRPLYPDYGETQ